MEGESRGQKKKEEREHSRDRPAESKYTKIDRNRERLCRYIVRKSCRYNVASLSLYIFFFYVLLFSSD